MLSNFQNRKAGILMIGLAVSLAFCCAPSTGPMKIEKERLQKMITNGDVKELIIDETSGNLEITLTPHSYRSDGYAKELKYLAIGCVKSGPHFFMQLDSLEEFLNWYERVTLNLPLSLKRGVYFQERIKYWDEKTMHPCTYN